MRRQVDRRFGVRSRCFRGRGGENLLDRGVLGGEVCLDLLGLFQHGSRIVVGGLGTGICGSGLNVLADDDDRQEDELQERLRDPGDNDDRIAGLERGRSAHEGEDCEEIRAPHRANDQRDLKPDLGVDAPNQTWSMDLGDGRRNLGRAHLFALLRMRMWGVVEDLDIAQE